MSRSTNYLDRLYVATPCSADWDLMEGDDKVRFCRHCHLHVYNISMLTNKQAEALIIKTEGRLCTKFYRRADGTILTQDCPVGLQAIRHSVSRVAGAALTAMLSLFAGGTVRLPLHASTLPDGGSQHMLKRTKAEVQDSRATLHGTIFDVNEAVIADVKVTIMNESTEETYTATTSEEGKFQFWALEEGSYTITVESRGFHLFRKKHLKLRANEEVELEVTLHVGSVGGAAFLPKKSISKDAAA